jgi:hypothetical protein
MGGFLEMPACKWRQFTCQWVMLETPTCECPLGNAHLEMPAYQNKFPLVDWVMQDWLLGWASHSKVLEPLIQKWHSSISQHFVCRWSRSRTEQASHEVEKSYPGPNSALKRCDSKNKIWYKSWFDKIVSWYKSFFETLRFSNPDVRFQTPETRRSTRECKNLTSGFLNQI